MATPNIVPRADSEGGLGTASKYWASAYIDLIYVGAGKMGRDADNLLDFSTDNKIKFRVGATNELNLDNNALYPESNNGVGLGYNTNAWSDLFLADGAVINFDNGNVVLTHSSNTLTLADSDVLALGTGSDLQLFHESNNSFIQNYVGDLTIRNFSDDSDIIFQSDDGSGGVTAYLTLDGGDEKIFVHKNMRLADGVEIELGSSNDLRIKSEFDTGFIRNYTGNFYILNAAADKDIIFQADDGSGGTTTYLTLDGSTTSMQAAKNIVFADSIRSVFGGGADLAIYHDGSNSLVSQEGTGDLIIRNITNDADVRFKSDDGAGAVTTYFYLDGSSATHDGSATTGLYTNWPDKSVISLGTSHDFTINHDGAHTYLSNTTGDLIIRNSADNSDIIFQNDDGSGGITEYFRLDGGLSSPFTVFQDNSTVVFGQGFDLRFFHDSNHSYISQQGTGNLYIRNLTDDADIVFQSDDGSGGTETYFFLDGSGNVGNIPRTVFPDNSNLVFGTGNDLFIRHNSANSELANFTGDLIFQQLADDKDIIFKSDDSSGGTMEYFRVDGGIEYTVFSRHARFIDNMKVMLGGSDDLQVYHDGANSALYNKTGDLYIMNTADDKDIIFQCDDGSGGVETYFYLDGSANGSNPLTVFPDGSNLAFGSAPDTYLMHNGTDFLLDNYNSGNIHIRNNVDDKDIIFSSDDGSGGTTAYITLDGGDVSTIVSTIKVMMPNLPTSNPSTAGQLWNDSGTLKISAG